MGYYLTVTLLCVSFIGLAGLVLILLPLKQWLSKVINSHTKFFHYLPLRTTHAPRAEPTFDNTNLGLLKPMHNTTNPLLEPIRFDQRVFCILYLMSPPNELYTGYVLWQALISQQLRYGAMKIFHAYENDGMNKQPLFSVASALEPGYFDSTHIDQIKTSGLCLFMHPPTLLKPLKAFGNMLKAGKRLEHLLGGKLSDNQRQPLSEAAIEAYRAKLVKLSDINEDYAEY